uniref:HIG1 domain family member 1C-like n=1 Tax=Myxine glutinosa TaxID=7769 RepID=UPI00358FED82
MAMKGIPWDASEHVEESLKDKARRKVRDNPMVPIGLLGGCIILGQSLKTMKNITDRRPENLSPILSRMRLASHSFAMGAIMLGVFFSMYRDYEKCSNDKNQTSLKK